MNLRWLWPVCTRAVDDYHGRLDEQDWDSRRVSKQYQLLACNKRRRQIFAQLQTSIYIYSIKYELNCPGVIRGRQSLLYQAGATLICGCSIAYSPTVLAAA